MNPATMLQQDVVEELAWDPSVDASHIGVTTTNDGIVTLAGHVGSYYEKASAERAAKRVSGVATVVNDLIVNPPYVRDDAEIARDALSGLALTVVVPTEHIKVLVEHGWVTLNGEVKWQFQKNAAEYSIWQVPGVRGVQNQLKVKAAHAASPGKVKDQIEAALARNAQIDAEGVKVETHDGIVTLRGSVNSWAQREAAEQAAWFAPGVEEVENLLEVDVLARGGV